MAPSTSADFAHQTLTVQSPYGPVQFTMDDLSYYVDYALRICVNYGTQLGASLILLAILVLVTSAEKRRSPVFLLNILALTFNAPRLILGCMYYTGPFYDPYAYLTTDYSGVGDGAKAASVGANVLTLLVLVCVLASLIFQIRVVSVLSTSTQRLCMTMLSISVAMVAVGFRFALMVLASRATVDIEATVDLAWLGNATNITMTISICFFCSIFLWKLGAAIKQRRRLGLQQFGPIHAIFIMSTQTLIIPAIFSIFQYVGDPIMLQSVVLTSVALFLPLSTMWAAAQGEKGTATAVPPCARRPAEKGVLDSCTTDSTAMGTNSEASGKASHHGSEPTTPK